MPAMQLTSCIIKVWVQDGDTGLNRDDFCITIDIDKEKRNLIITDNGLRNDKRRIGE